MLVFFFLLCYVCNASLQHLRASLLEPAEPGVQSLDLYERCLQQDSNPFPFGGSGSGGKSDGIICSTHDECQSGRCQCFKSGSRRCGQCPATMPSNGDRCRLANQVCPYGPQLCCTCPPGGACAPDRPLQNTAMCNGINWEVTSLVIDCAPCPTDTADDPTPNSLVQVGTGSIGSVGSVGTLAPTTDSLVQVATTSSCCDPTKEPGKNGNPTCFEGHACCPTTGQWVCGSGSGSFSCSGGFACPPRDLCCDPKTQPGLNGIPNCNGGYACCPNTGQWLCASGGSFSCSGGKACLGPAARCCDGMKEPGRFGNTDCFFSHVCCITGDWSCISPFTGNDCKDGQIGRPCYERDRCCDVNKEPGRNGNPMCFYDHACCRATGQWVCGSSSGQFSCSGGIICGV